MSESDKVKIDNSGNGQFNNHSHHVEHSQGGNVIINLSETNAPITLETIKERAAIIKLAQEQAAALSVDWEQLVPPHFLQPRPLARELGELGKLLSQANLGSMNKNKRLGTDPPKIEKKSPK